MTRCNLLCQAGLVIASLCYVSLHRKHRYILESSVSVFRSRNVLRDSSTLQYGTFLLNVGHILEKKLLEVS